MSDGFDGIHVGSFLGRDVAEEDADEHTDEERYADAPGRNTRWHSKHWNDEFAGAAAYQDAQ